MHSRDNAAVTEPSEAELALRASKGDVDAFSSLYEQYFDRIYRYAFFKTSHQAGSGRDGQGDVGWFGKKPKRNI